MSITSTGLGKEGRSRAPSAIDPDLYYSIKETARYFKVHQSTIHRWLKSRALSRDLLGPHTARIKGSTILELERRSKGPAVA
jgi:hypothetical protein